MREWRVLENDEYKSVRSLNRKTRKEGVGKHLDNEEKLLTDGSPLEYIYEIFYGMSGLLEKSELYDWFSLDSQCLPLIG